MTNRAGFPGVTFLRRDFCQCQIEFSGLITSLLPTPLGIPTTSIVPCEMRCYLRNWRTRSPRNELSSHGHSSSLGPTIVINWLLGCGVMEPEERGGLNSHAMHRMSRTQAQKPRHFVWSLVTLATASQVSVGSPITSAPVPLTRQPPQPPRPALVVSGMRERARREYSNHLQAGLISVVVWYFSPPDIRTD